MIIYYDEVWFIVTGYVDNMRKPNDVVYIVHSLERLRHEPFQTGMIWLFCVQSLIKSWISSYIIYMSQENKQVCIIGIILIISEKETADKVCHSAKHRHFNNAVLTKGWKLQCNTCSHFVAMQTHDNGSNMFHYLDISSS